MSTKSIESTETGQVIHTVNGMDTRTHRMYNVAPLTEWTPLPNGFNRQLADHMLEIITANQELWDQGNWRLPFEIFTPTQRAERARLIDKGEIWAESDLTRSDAAADLLASIAEPTKPSCGTVMCAAGWIGEITLADWVADALVMNKLGLDYVDEYEDHVILSEAWLDEHAPSKELLSWQADPSGSAEPVERERWNAYVFRLANQHSHYDGSLTPVGQALAARGFDLEHSWALSVDVYAAICLGLVQTARADRVGDAMAEGRDWLGLFAGTNTLGDIRRKIEAYAEFGPVYNHDVYKAHRFSSGEEEE